MFFYGVVSQDQDYSFTNVPYGFGSEINLFGSFTATFGSCHEFGSEVNESFFFSYYKKNS